MARIVNEIALSILAKAKHVAKYFANFSCKRRGVYTKQPLTTKTKLSAKKFGCRMEGKELLAALVVFVLMAIMGMVFAQQYLR